MKKVHVHMLKYVFERAGIRYDVCLKIRGYILEHVSRKIAPNSFIG